MSFNLISNNTRQMFIENFYLVTEELCHTSTAEMINVSKSLVNSVKDLAIKADALIQTLFEKEIRDEIVTTLKQVSEPIYKIIVETPLSKAAKIIGGTVVGCSTYNAINKETSALPIAFAHCAIIAGATAIIFGILSRSKFKSVFPSSSTIVFAEISFLFGLTAMSTYYTTSSIDEMKPNFKRILIQNCVQGIIVCLTWIVPSTMSKKIVFSKLKEPIPNIVGTQQKKLKSFDFHIEYKKTDQILKEADSRVISAFENNVAELIHDYIGIKNKAGHRLHVKIKNLLKKKFRSFY